MESLRTGLKFPFPFSKGNDGGPGFAWSRLSVTAITITSWAIVGDSYFLMPTIESWCPYELDFTIIDLLLFIIRRKFLS